MSYTTRQVQNLLTKPELELFQASRIGAIKAFNARQLVGKISRARALRDKYRDLYQRQTVRTGTAPATPRKVTGTANLRTDVKADVMQEVLGRFEAQFEKVQSPPRPGQQESTCCQAGARQGHRQGRHRHARGEWHHPQAAGAHPTRGNRFGAGGRAVARRHPQACRQKTRNTLCGNPNRHHLRRQDGPHQGSRRTRQNPGQGSARHRSQEICRSERPRQAQQPQGR